MVRSIFFPNCRQGRGVVVDVAVGTLAGVFVGAAVLVGAGVFVEVGTGVLVGDGEELRHRLAPAHNLAWVWDTFFLARENEVCIRMQSSPLDEVPRYVTSAAHNPPFWLAYAEDRKVEFPAYAVSDFKEEIRVAGASGEQGGCTDGERTRYCRLRVYCAKLDRVVSPGQCPGRDQGLSIRQELLR